MGILLALFLDHLYPEHDVFEFSNDWLESFKDRHGIKSFRRFGESGSVDMTLIEKSLPDIRETLDKYEWKDIYNIDETGLFYRLQVSWYKLSCLQHFVTLCASVNLFTGR